ncbi:hypothetical protein EYF80_012834 [Liparis tanakae]|uniref:Uncharacterized protein n=1 Tax=Liparis tanakae TaxID=230148 RepID=A0A4Z2IGF7_9TELE|nr:hypothetical protein EYF80_012834 [Liparis tanakae]
METAVKWWQAFKKNQKKRFELPLRVYVMQDKRLVEILKTDTESEFLFRVPKADDCQAEASSMSCLYKGYEQSAAHQRADTCTIYSPRTLKLKQCNKRPQTCPSTAIPTHYLGSVPDEDKWKKPSRKSRRSCPLSPQQRAVCQGAINASFHRSPSGPEEEEEERWLSGSEIDREKDRQHESPVLS